MTSTTKYIGVLSVAMAGVSVVCRRRVARWFVICRVVCVVSRSVATARALRFICFVWMVSPFFISKRLVVSKKFISNLDETSRKIRVESR